MANTSSRKPLTIALTIVGLLLVTPVVLIILLATGYTVGEEFSPDDFSRRTFTYNRMPGLKWTIMGKHHDNTTPALEQIMVTDGLIIPTNNSPKVWHLCFDSDSPHSADCDARILTDYLDMKDKEGDFYWESWNDKFPESAKAFWPVVADLARREMYLAVPDIMRFGMETENDNSENFEKGLDKLASKLYFTHGQIDHEQNQHERALDRMNRSIEIRATREAHQLRADIHEVIGNSDAAIEDRETAKKLNSL